MIYKTFIVDVDKATTKNMRDLLGEAKASKGKIQVLVRVDQRDWMGFPKDELEALKEDTKKFPVGLKDALVRMVEDEDAVAVGYQITSGKGKFTWNGNDVTIGKGCMVLIIGDEAIQKIKR